MDQIVRQRRSESAWREIVARQEQSGLTVFLRARGTQCGQPIRLARPTAAGTCRKERSPADLPKSPCQKVLRSVHRSGSDRFEPWPLRSAAGFRWRRAAAPGPRLMFFPEGHIRVHLYGYPCDMRKSFPGLYALTRQGLQANPLSVDLYVFISRRATMMKVLYFVRSGFCIWW